MRRRLLGDCPVVASKVDDRLVIGAFAVITLVVTGLTSEVYDDPWILYRYAENLAHGEGWTFNPSGTSSNAVTSPLAVLLLAAAVAMGVPVAWGSGILFAGGTWGAASCTYLALKRLGHPTAGIAAAVLLMTAPPLLSLRGMETPLYLALVAAVLLLLTTSRRLLLGVVLALAVLARPDAALFVCITLAWLAATERTVPWRTLAGAALIAVPWMLVSIPLTGGLLPSSLEAKVAQADSGEWSGYIRGLEHAVLSSELTPWFLFAFALALFGVVPGIRLWRSPLLTVAIFGVALVAAYGLVLGVAFYPWYAALPVFLLIVLAGLGAEALLALLPNRLRWAVAAVLLVGGVAAAFLTPQMTDYRRDSVALGAWIRENTMAGDRVAAAELGRVGYFCGDCQMVDYLGLLDEDANQHVARAEWTWWVDAQRPDYWVTYRDDGEGGGFVPDLTVRRDSRFQERYEKVWEFDEMVIYRLRD